MRQLSRQELAGLGASTSFNLNDLLGDTGLTPARKPIADDYDAQMSGAVQQTNSRGSLTARAGKKDETLWLNTFYRKDFDFFGNDDDGLFGGLRRRPRGRGRRRVDADSKRKADADGERKAKAEGEDGERKAKAEDGDTRVANADEGDVRANTGDAETKRTITADAEAPRVMADAPETPRAPETHAAPDTARMITPEAPETRAVTPELPEARTVSAEAPKINTTAPRAPVAEAPRVMADAPETLRAPETHAAPDTARMVTPEAPETRAVTPELDIARLQTPMAPSVLPDTARPIIVDLEQIRILQPEAPRMPEIPSADIDANVRAVAVDGFDAPRVPVTLSPALSGVTDVAELPSFDNIGPRVGNFDAMDMPPDLATPEVDTAHGFDATSAGRFVSPSISKAPNAPDTPSTAGLETPDMATFFRNSHDGIYVDLDTPEMRAPELSEARIVTPTTDADVVRSQTPDIIDIPKADTAPTVRTATAASPWDTHLESRGSSREAFNEAVETRAPDNAIDIGGRGANAPAAHFNAGRAGRFTRLMMPNGLDYAFIAGFAGFAAYQTAHLTIDKDGLGVGVDGMAVANAAADAAPWIDAIAAKARGRNDEAWVRTAVNGVETATPFVFAAGGAYIGGAGGSAAGGVGAIPGALLGGVGGFVVGLVASGGISIAVDEGLRAYGRGAGWDVDRGFVSSMLAPEYADEMEAWVRNVYGNDIEGLPEGATPQQVIDDILDSTEDPLEQITRFREFMTLMNNNLHAQQEAQIESIREIVETQTGITDIRAVLDGPEEEREAFISFYQDQLDQDMNNESAQMVLNAIEEYNALQENRFSIQQGIINADIMNAVSLNEELRDNVHDAMLDTQFAFRAARHNEAMIPELLEIDAESRLTELYRNIETQQDDVNTDTNALIQAVAANGGDAYAATGSTTMVVEALTLYMDMEDALQEAAERVATANMDSFKIFFDNYDRLRIDLDALREEYGDNMPEAVAELERIIEESDNFSNLTEDQKISLATNPAFHHVIANSGDHDGWFWQTNPNQDLKDAYFDLRHNLSNDGFLQIGGTLQQVRQTHAELEQTLKGFGVDHESEPVTDSTAEMAMRRKAGMEMGLHGPQ